jgi:hypothetical protein
LGFSGKTTLAYQTGLWFQYVQNFKAYLCPVDIESKTFAMPGGRNNNLSTYVMNGAVTGYTAGSYGIPCKIDDVWNPACYLLWEPDENASGQGNPGAFEYIDGANYPGTGEGIGRLHSANNGDMLCLGGNVQFVSVKTFQIQSGMTSKSLAWWSPFSSNGH